MTTSNGTVVEQVEGLVESVNERGVKVAGEWRNVSKFHPVELPDHRARVRLELDNKGFIRTLQVLERAPSAGQNSSNPDRTSTRLACLKAAATFCGHYATVHEDVKSADVLKIAEAFERWGARLGLRAGVVNHSADARERVNAPRALPTREAWLLGLANALRPFYGRHKAALPRRIRISVGWPSRSATTARARRIGECWYTASDGLPQVFISPTLSDPLHVGATLVHELVHATLGPGAGHGPAFRKIATRLGLAGPMRATHASPELVAILQQLVQALGPYPHAALAAGGGPGRTDGTRMLKLTCPTCGYTVRTTRKWLAVGPPFCPDGDPLETAHFWRPQ